MARIVKCISIGYSPIKDDAAIHGSDIGKIGNGQTIYVDMDREHDKWVPIVGPAPLGPTWLKTGKQGWIELSHASPVVEGQVKYLVTISAKDGTIISVKRVG